MPPTVRVIADKSVYAEEILIAEILQCLLAEEVVGQRIIVFADSARRSGEWSEKWIGLSHSDLDGVCSYAIELSDFFPSSSGAAHTFNLLHMADMFSSFSQGRGFTLLPACPSGELRFVRAFSVYCWAGIGIPTKLGMVCFGMLSRDLQTECGFLNSGGALLSMHRVVLDLAMECRYLPERCGLPLPLDSVSLLLIMRDGERSKLSVRLNGDLLKVIEGKEMTRSYNPEEVLPVTISLGEISMSLGDFLSLRPGSQIIIDKPEVFRGALVVGGRLLAHASIKFSDSEVILGVDRLICQ